MWVLTSFNDPEVKLVKNTSDVEELRSSLKELKYGGGKDPEEQAFVGAIYLEYKPGILTWNINLDYKLGI